MGVCDKFSRDLSELTFYELSGVDDGVDGSDVEESDVDDVGVDGDEFFRYSTLLFIFALILFLLSLKFTPLKNHPPKERHLIAVPRLKINYILNYSIS